jgi:large subunit ribosomal protein L25
MSEIVLETHPRAEHGHGRVKRMRHRGLIPAIVYGGQEAPLSIVIDAKHFTSVVKGRVPESTIFDLELEGMPRKKALIREVQVDPVTDQILHIDFQRILMTERITLNVDVVAVGEPVGVKTDGGILDHILREIEIRCLPGDIPSRVELDVSALKIGDSLHVSDLSVPNVEILTPLDTPVVTVLPPAAEKVEKPEVVVVAEAEAPAEPELVKKKKEAAAEEEEKGAGKEEK